MKKVENKNVMEAIISGGLLLAYSDGEKEDSEVQKLEQLIRANQNLKHFGQEITSTINRIDALLAANYQVGRVQCLREIGDVKNNPNDAEEVFVNMAAIATADGELEEGEAKELKHIARILNINPADYGLSL